MNIDRDEIERLTEAYGGQWGLNHTRRLLRLVAIIGNGLQFDQEAVWLAAHLHDWGAYPQWAQKDVDHALRSAEVAEAFLRERGCPEEFSANVVACIRLHHLCGLDRSLESVLLSDADILDFLGVVGVLRDFSKNPKEMRKAVDTIKKRRETLPGHLVLDRANESAAERLRQMAALLVQFEQDSGGFF